MNTRTALRLPILALLLGLAAGCTDPGPAAGHEEHDDHEEHVEGDDHQDHEDHEDHDEHEAEEGVVRLTPAQVAAADLGIAVAGPATLRERLPLYGVIAPNAERVRDITPRFPGVIRSVARRPGDTVRAGETLATVESDESLQTYSITAPLAGVVIARDANPGEQTGDRVLFTVADLGTVWVEVALFPRDRARVRAGQRVRVRSGGTGQEADGEVAWVAPFGSTANQTVTARVLLDNRDGHWSPGLYVTAEVLLAETPVPVAVRNEALQVLDRATVVFAGTSDGFRPRAVSTGREDGEATEITGGLEAGTRYVARNSFILKAELGKGEAAHEH